MWSHKYVTWSLFKHEWKLYSFVFNALEFSITICDIHHTYCVLFTYSWTFVQMIPYCSENINKWWSAFMYCICWVNWQLFTIVICWVYLFIWNKTSTDHWFIVSFIILPPPIPPFLTHRDLAGTMLA